MPTPEQLSRQSIVTELYVAIVGWIWVAASLAAVYFLVRAVFFGDGWWPVVASVAVAWFLYKVSLYYVLEKSGQHPKATAEVRSPPLKNDLPKPKPPVSGAEVSAKGGTTPESAIRIHAVNSLEGIPKEYARVTVLRELAKQGLVEPQRKLGSMYRDGRGVDKNECEAVKWYRLAAEQGDAIAQLQLGTMYDGGEGVPRNSTETVKWYRLAAEQGDQAAQFILGDMYADGEGVPRDYVFAHMWLNLSASQGEQGAAERRDAVANSMTSTQTAEAQRLAREWKLTRRERS